MNINVLKKLKLHSNRDLTDDEVKKLDDAAHMQRIAQAVNNYAILTDDEKRIFRLYFNLQTSKDVQKEPPL